MDLDLVRWLVLEADEQVGVHNLEEFAPRHFDHLNLGIRDDMSAYPPQLTQQDSTTAALMSLSQTPAGPRANRTQAHGGKAGPLQTLVCCQKPGVVEVPAR